MSDVESYILALDNDKDAASSTAQDTAQNLQSGKITLIDVVKSLGEYINDENASIRNKTSSYLTAVINALPLKYLSRQQIEVLCQFYCDRVEDGEGTAGLEGLSALVKLDRFGGEMVETVARAVFANFQDMQIRPVGQRNEILRLVNVLLESHRNSLIELREEALVGTVDLVSGEKDPRNLMLVFSMLRVFMAEWDITAHVEVLFDAVFCYFPIAFKPPPNDPYGITGQDLKDRLRDCIAASSEFAPYSFPALLDKLDNPSPIVKKDVLQTLKACALSYNMNTMSRYSITLWDSLKYEILSAQEEDLAEEALLALRAIAERLSDQQSTAPTSQLAQYLRPIMKECNEQLQEPQQKQAKPAGKIVCSLASASDAAYALIIKAVLAPLLTVYQDTDGHAKQRALLEVLVGLFESAVMVFGKRGTTQLLLPLENPLDAFRDRLQELFSQALMSTNKEEVSFRVIALRGLICLASVRDLLQEDEIGIIVQYLNEIVLVEQSYGRDEVKQEAIQGLAQISKSSPRLISDITFPTFMATLPDSDTENGQYLAALEGLAQIGRQKELLNTLIRRLLNKLDVVLGGKSTAAYPRAILSTALYVLEREGLERQSEVETYYYRIVVDLFRRAVSPLTQNTSLTSLNDESVLDVLGRLSTLIIQSLPTERQHEVSKHIYNLFALQEGLTEKDCVSRQLSRPECQTMILSTYLLAAIPPSSYPPDTISDRPSFLQDLFELLVGISVDENLSLSPASTLAVHRQISLLVNKFKTPSTFVIQRLANILEEITSSPVHQSNLLQRISLAFNLSRPLISILSPGLPDLLGRLVDLVSHPAAEISTPSARGFALLLAPDPVLEPRYGFTKRLLHKQKVFTTLVPVISRRIHETTLQSTKANLLVALSGILVYAPQEVVLPHLPTLLPLLLQTLDLDIVEPTHAVKNATLETLALVIREAPAAIDESGHTTSLVNRLLRTSSFALPSTSSLPGASAPSPPHTRLLSLQLLGLFPASLNQPSLLSLKSKVLRQLSLCADDPRRNVRKESVDCRTKWLSIDEPDRDED